MDDFTETLAAAGKDGQEFLSRAEHHLAPAARGPLGDGGLAALIAHMAPPGDPEEAHRLADLLLLRELHALGYRRAIAAWLAAEKWFS